MHIAINFVLFQVGWFAAVTGAANRMEWLAVSSIALIIIVHLLLVKHRSREIKLIVAAGLTGFIVDSLLITQGVFSPASYSAVLGPLPCWLLALWMLFAITINHSLGWLGRHYILQAVAGLVFAPMAYYAGYKMQALDIGGGSQFYVSLLIIGICWMFIIPLLFKLATIINHRSTSNLDSVSFLH